VKFAAAFYRSFSILQLVLLGFVVVTLPLLAALATALASFDQLTRQGRQTVLETVQAIQASRTLVEETLAMERHVRQYQVLKDRALFTVYEGRRQQFLAALQEARAARTTEALTAALSEMEVLDQDIYTVLRTSDPRSAEVQESLRNFTTLESLARMVFLNSMRIVDSEIQAIQAQSDAAREQLLWQASALIPLALVLAVVSTVLITRPVRQLGQAVRRLGNGDFGHDIRITGPHDLAYLGACLEWLRRRLLELEQRRTTFLRHISHELKTPLANIREGTELLSEQVMGELNGPQQEIVGIVRSNSLQLQRRIEDLLNFSVSQSAVPALQSTSVPLDELLAELTAQHKVSALARGVRVECVQGRRHVLTDREKLRVILDNLVSNAVKFTPEGGHVRLCTGADAGVVWVEVQDDGPGMSPEERGRVFDPFFQGQASARGLVPGSGLGLSIAWEYARALRGRLEVLDSANGARLRVTLPALDSPPVEPLPTSAF
jgi:two-component system sensor histidine kinase GlrK